MKLPGLNGQNDISEEAVKERSYLWMARVFGLVCVVTLIADLILLSAIDSLRPLVRVQPFYIWTQDKDRLCGLIGQTRKCYNQKRFKNLLCGNTYWPGWGSDRMSPN